MPAGIALLSEIKNKWLTVNLSVRLFEKRKEADVIFHYPVKDTIQMNATHRGIFRTFSNI